MSNTPETDAAWEKLCCSGDSWYSIAEKVKILSQRLERERDEARDMVENLTDHGLNLMDSNRMLKRERGEARAELEEYRSIAEKIGATKAVSERDKAVAERDEAREKYDILATENMLEVNKLCNERDDAREKYMTLLTDNMLEVHKLYKEREQAREALMKIEEIFIDGEDTYEDWRRMGNIAREAIEKYMII